MFIKTQAGTYAQSSTVSAHYGGGQTPMDVDDVDVDHKTKPKYKGRGQSKGNILEEVIARIVPRTAAKRKGKQRGMHNAQPSGQGKRYLQQRKRQDRTKEKFEK